MSLSQRVLDLIVGQPFGEVSPPRVDPIQPAHDARTAALKVLKLYLSELTFYRAGDIGGAPIPFQVPPDHIKTEPVDSVDDAQMPAITFVPGDGTSEALGLGAYLEETSKDVYAPGTAVQWQSEYAETFTIEIVCATRAQRRAVVAGVVRAMSPTEFMYGIRFRMPDYFDQLVVFVINRRSLSRDYGSSMKRRHIAEIQVEMKLTEVSLQNVVEVQPRVDVDVKSPGSAFDPATDAELLDDGTIATRVT